jgi:hypothetical protein
MPTTSTNTAAWVLHAGVVTSAASHSTNGNTTNDPKNAITAKRAKPLRGEGQCFCSKAKVAQLHAANKIKASPGTHCTPDKCAHSPRTTTCTTPPSANSTPKPCHQRNRSFNHSTAAKQMNTGEDA